MNHEELTKRRKELIDERAARLEEWRKLIQLEDRPPLAISLIGFIFAAVPSWYIWWNIQVFMNR